MRALQTPHSDLAPPNQLSVEAVLVEEVRIGTVRLWGLRIEELLSQVLYTPSLRQAPIPIKERLAPSKPGPRLRHQNLVNPRRR